MGSLSCVAATQALILRGCLTAGIGLSAASAIAFHAIVVNVAQPAATESPVVARVIELRARAAAAAALVASSAADAHEARSGLPSSKRRKKAPAKKDGRRRKRDTTAKTRGHRSP